MAIVNLYSLLREPTYRLTDKAAFTQAISRISAIQSKREKEAAQPPRERQKEA
ncbi:MAG: hypothetical protein NT018_06170 [Armatimonadetes bacterium]|nr:hypothetical protein [Armatimonadota bacterium]